MDEYDNETDNFSNDNKQISIIEIKVGNKVYRSIEIIGFSGNASLLYDGIYDPCSTLCNESNIPLYKKRGLLNTGTQIILEYRSSLKQFQIKTSKYKGSGVCFAMTKVSNVNTNNSLETILNRPWIVSVWTGSEEKWETTDLKVISVRRSYEASGITGHLEYINGIYDPINITSILPTYKHREHPSIFFQQTPHEWQIIDAETNITLYTRIQKKSFFTCCFFSIDDTLAAYSNWRNAQTDSAIPGLLMSCMEQSVYSYETTSTLQPESSRRLSAFISRFPSSRSSSIRTNATQNLSVRSLETTKEPNITPRTSDNFSLRSYDSISSQESQAGGENKASSTAETHDDFDLQHSISREDSAPSAEDDSSDDLSRWVSCYKEEL